MWLLCQYLHKRKEVFCFSFEFEHSGVQPSVGWFPLYQGGAEKEVCDTFATHAGLVLTSLMHWDCWEQQGIADGGVLGIFTNVDFYQTEPKKNQAKTRCVSSSSSGNIYSVPVDRAQEASPLRFPFKEQTFKKIYKKYKALYTFSAELTSVQARNSK